jgi:hypothetical protein
MKTLALFLIASVAPAITIQLDNATTLLDGSLFTLNAQYVAAFQLNSGGVATGTLADLSRFRLGGGVGLGPTAQDLVLGFYTIGPAAQNPPTSIWEPNGTLTLIVDRLGIPPYGTQAVYTQSFVAGTEFVFDLNLVSDGVAGLTPDQFTFQLYDSTFSSLLYEVALDAVAEPNTAVPEPATGAGVAIAVVALALWRRRTIGGCRS